ncbi:protein-export chaperone SecB [Thermoanaerobacterium thermosaccharolyticum]|uniref:Preprotein translocase subunit SecB n=1 Tax=Thermoanaerobacterium thermosaccharolyticum TaxID=1517 RepID=A0A231VMN6_THETR|nr:protein-export chaperone SecB [Thermoanaerobacterium thermosaccharolyticum]MCP2239500.1 preprotein translocase subunit SecB [Thermoanaerobacterium thermosaccharolyticum]OXT09535.1 preprotein translocase subunit SecB [Thermoanaerobacterium thermosaccharolyticum]
MINANKVLADFQFLANRVSEFKIETRDIRTNEFKVHVTYDFDYNIKEVKEFEDKYIGYIEFITVIKAKVKNSILFKINLTMEGVFVGNIQKLKRDDFLDMLELNGLTTLSQLSRAYILTVTSLSGINPPVKLPMVNIFKLIQQKKNNEAKKVN